MEPHPKPFLPQDMTKKHSAIAAFVLRAVGEGIVTKNLKKSDTEDEGWLKKGT